MSDKDIRVLDGECSHAEECPLSRIEAGSVVCIKNLTASPETSTRLRELGFFERQKLKLVSRHSNYICQVCNARLGISKNLADSIIVEPVGGQS